MHDRPGGHRWGPAAALALLLIVPLLYPLSLGPVVLMYNALGQPRWMGYLEVVYEPLDKLPEPAHSMLERYIEFWNR